MKIQQWLLEGAVLFLAAAWLCLSKPTDKRNIMLPLSLQPEQYEISLAPRLEKGVFHGIVVIDGVAVTETDRIVLHCKSLMFNTTTLTDLTTDEEVEVENIEEDLLLQQCHLFLNQSLQPDHEYRLTIEFMGIISKEGVGLYTDFYKENGVRHDILMTHFQPNYARAMFPCWDEPHYKAQFLLRVTRQHFPTILSNMPVSSVSLPDPEENNRTWVEFEETPPMSTYLLVLVMCDYLALSDSVTNTSVWAPRSRLHEAQLALNVSVAVLEECERYFGTEYVLPKLDHVPVPSLNTVAMENWGAITYKKDFLLWEEGVSTWAQRETITYVICHEIVHQWLGNLVTTGWWNTTWLNEGVTSFYHYYIMDKVEPSWNVMDTMFVTQIQLIFNDEALKDPKPLTNNEPLLQDSISDLAFSASTYLKGAAIIRMVFNLMAPDVFREAISQYIIDNQFGCVDEEDFWESLTAVADLPVDLESVMYPWTHQPGFPLVTVERDADGCVRVRQEKYLGKDESDARWTIPLTYTTSSELDFNFSSTVWFPEEQTEMALEECIESTDWIIVNVRQTGFYRVNYDLLTWQLLTHDLMNCDISDIHTVNRAQLLNDGFDLARHGLLEYPVILDLTRYLRRETEFLPWFVAIQWFNILKMKFYPTDTFPLFQSYTIDLIDNVFNSMPLSGEVGGLLAEDHRKQVVEFACGMSHPQCVKEATDTVYLLMSGVDVKIPLDLKPVLLCTAVKHGQDEVWHFVLKEYLGAAENERWKYLGALACTSDKENLERLLKDVAGAKSFVKTTEEWLNLLVEIGKQENALDPILDMVLAKFHVLNLNYDFEVVLHLLKTFLTQTPTIDQRQKINALSALVNKAHDPKQTEMMESIMEELEREDFKTLHDEPVKEWFRREVEAQTEDDEEEDSTTDSLSSTTSIPESAEDTEEPDSEKNDNQVEKADSDEVESAEETNEPGCSNTNSVSIIAIVINLVACIIR